jgi:hypothetical protein
MKSRMKDQRVKFAASGFAPRQIGCYVVRPDGGRAMYRRTASVLMRGLVLLVACATAGCGGGDDFPPPTIAIKVPTTAPTFTTTATAIRIGGTISRASFMRLHNELTGTTEQGFVNYLEGQGSWFCDIGLAVGDNPLVATADSDGTGARTASARILVTRN